MFKFIHEPAYLHRDFEPAVKKLEMTLKDQANLEEILLAFEEFLKGCGYVFDGNLEITNDDYLYAEQEEPILSEEISSEVDNVVRGED